MDEKINADLKSLKFILNKNRPYIIPIAIILISIILFFQFVIPQFGTLLATRKEFGEASLKLETLKENLNILTNINESSLDSQLRTLTLALPLNKDFIGVLNSIYLTSQRTGANLGSFSFRVGDISKSENDDKFPVVKLSVPINSSFVVINSFIETIIKTVPLSEVSLVKVGDTSSAIDISFYYKPLGVSNYSQDARISPISQKGLTLVGELDAFESFSSSPIPSNPATSSAQ